jgi:hypothetical protein
MAWVLRLVETGIDGPTRVIDVTDIRPLDAVGDIANLGLTLSEAKQILTRLQQTVISVQAGRSRGSASGLLCLRSSVSRQGVAASSAGNAVRHGAGAAPAVSLCRLWSWRDGYRLAVILPVHA